MLFYFLKTILPCVQYAGTGIVSCKTAAALTRRLVIKKIDIFIRSTLNFSYFSFLTFTKVIYYTYYFLLFNNRSGVTFLTNCSSVIRGTAFHSTGPDSFDILEDHLFLINEAGVLDDVVSPKDDRYDTILRQSEDKGSLHRLKSQQYLLPGFIDTHVHAPQWPK